MTLILKRMESPFSDMLRFCQLGKACQFTSTPEVMQRRRTERSGTNGAKQQNSSASSLPSWLRLWVWIVTHKQACHCLFLSTSMTFMSVPNDEGLVYGLVSSKSYVALYDFGLYLLLLNSLLPKIEEEAIKGRAAWEQGKYCLLGLTLFPLVFSVGHKPPVFILLR